MLENETETWRKCASTAKAETQVYQAVQELLEMNSNNQVRSGYRDSQLAQRKITEAVLSHQLLKLLNTAAKLNYNG